jgi:hypothetical protein
MSFKFRYHGGSKKKPIRHLCNSAAVSIGMGDASNNSRPCVSSSARVFLNSLYALEKPIQDHIAPPPKIRVTKTYSESNELLIKSLLPKPEYRESRQPCRESHPPRNKVHTIIPSSSKHVLIIVSNVSLLFFCQFSPFSVFSLRVGGRACSSQDASKFKLLTISISNPRQSISIL